VDEALAIARQIVDALDYAHEHGVLHRDLKPANIKVTPEDQVKVLDFGLAKAVAPPGAGAQPASPDASPTITSPAFTQAGVILGTAAYMAPEQVRGQALDKRADVWAFGCTLYEMLTGARAFAGSTVSYTLAAVLKDDPDWSRLPPSTPATVRLLLQRCLARDLRTRLRDIADARLRRWRRRPRRWRIAGAGSSPASPPRPWQRSSEVRGTPRVERRRRRPGPFGASPCSCQWRSRRRRRAVAPRLR
jgi:serine/threonine protein kinase